MAEEIIYPARNLGPAENWGRAIESRLEWAGRQTTVNKQFSDGGNRSLASRLSDLSRVAEEATATANQVANAILEFPQYFSVSDTGQGFSVGSGWTTIASLTLPQPPGFTTLDILAEGNAQVFNPEGSTDDSFDWPFSLQYVTSEYGWRTLSNGDQNFHNGIDFSYGGISGDPIPASGDGTILLCDYFDDWGNYVRIQHPPRAGATIWTGYAHMIRLPNWNIGDPIRKGQTVGYVGTTGYSTGAHLHFETAVNGVRRNPRDFMDSIYNGPQLSTVNTQCRILISGRSEQTFNPLNAIGDVEVHHAIAGATIDVRRDVTVSLQMRGTVPSRSTNRATLTVTGGFSK